MKKAPLRTLIIGYGYMGEIRRGVIEQNPRLELAGICETRPEIRKNIIGAQVFEDYEQALGENVDIVFVCTPNNISPDICIKSLNLGKHVFCEKPPGRSVDDIKEIMRAENPSTKLMFGFNHRFHPGILRAKLIATDKRLGNILGLRGIYGKSGGANFKHSWRNKRQISGGGILLDQGIHMMDIFRFFCGDFDEVKCFADNRFWKFDVEDNAFVILKNSSGQMASLHSSSTLWKHTFRLDIILEKGYIVCEGLLSKSGSYGREKLVIARREFEDESNTAGNPMEEIAYFDRDTSWELEVEEFVKCIDQNIVVTKSSSRDALRVMELIEQAYQDAGIRASEVCPK